MTLRMLKNYFLFFIFLLLSISLQAQSQPEENGCPARRRAKCNNKVFGPTAAFRKSDLSDSHFMSAKFLGNSFSPNDYINLLATDLSEARFNQAVLEYVDLTGTKLRKTDFSDIIASEVRFDRVMNGFKTIFKNATFKKVTFNNSPREGFRDADFEHASFENTTFENINLTASNFSHAKFEGAIFKDANLEDVGFQCATLNHVKFEDISSSEGIKLRGADLSKAILDKNTQRSFKSHYCGTKLEDGKYHSTAADCTIPDGESSERYCQGEPWPKHLPPAPIPDAPKHIPPVIPEPTPVAPTIPVALGNCELRPDICEEYSRDLLGSMIYFTAEMDCLSVKVNKQSACFYKKEHATFHVCKAIATTHNPCLKASADECGIGEYSLCHLK